MSLHYLLRGQLTYMQQHGFDVIAISADGKEREDIQTTGIRHEIIPFTRKITPIQDLICLWQLIRLFKKIKPNIVHTHTPKAGLLGMLAAWLCRVPLRVHTVAGLPLMEATGFKFWLLKQTERMTFACAHRIFPNSFGLLQFIQEQWKVKSEKLQVIGQGSSNGIDTKYFSRNHELVAQAQALRAAHHISEQAMCFVFVGRIVKDKGMNELLAAFQSLLQNKPDARLILVGEMESDLDPLSPADIEYIQSSPQIISTGFQKDVRPWMLVGDVFVFPSYREGFPNVVMQAACLGLPCIVSDINGCNELIQHEQSGLIVPVKNAEALSNAMWRLANDADLRRRYATAARAYIVQHFEQNKFWEALLHNYQRCMQERGLG